MARIVATARDELNRGCSAGWMLRYRAGKISTLMPKISEMAMTKVLRISIMREVMI